MRALGRLALASVALVVLAAGPARAQLLRAGIHGIGLTYDETQTARRVEGEGVGGLLSVRWKRFGLDVSGFTATMRPDTGPDFDLRQGDVRVSYAFAPAVALELGTGVRKVTPRFAAQEIGIVRVGILSEMPLNRLAMVWLRGAYLAGARFSGGGTADLAVELGMGVGVGTANGRFRGRAEFAFQRIDRKASGLSVPIELATAQLGLDVGLF